MCPMPIQSLVAFLLAGAALAASGPARSEEVVNLPAVRDNTLFEDAEGDLSDGAGPTFFVGENSPARARRGLIAFDVASAVPEGSTIIGAELRLHVSNAPDSTSVRVITLHRVLSDWGEGASVSSGGSGAPATAGDATWLHTFYPDLFWTQAGGDFEFVGSASAPVGYVGSYSWSEPAMIDDVQLWLDRPDLAFGWLLRGEENVAGSARRFDSRENPVDSDRPVLVVTYTPPVPVKTGSWGEFKARFRP